MTSIISLTTPGCALQATDRQLSMHGRAWDREANKLVLFHAADAIVSIAYTGRAFIRGRPTDHWIAEHLYGEELSAATTLRLRRPMPRLGLALHRLGEALSKETPATWRVPGTALSVCGVQWPATRHGPDRRSMLLRRPVMQTAVLGRDGCFVFRSVASRAVLREQHVVDSHGSHRPDEIALIAQTTRLTSDAAALSTLLSNEVRALSLKAGGFVGPSPTVVAFTPDAVPAKVTVKFVPDASDGWAVQGGPYPGIEGTVCPWIVTSGGAMPPSVLTGIRYVRVDDTTVHVAGGPGVGRLQGRQVTGFGTQNRRLPIGQGSYLTGDGDPA